MKRGKAILVLWALACLVMAIVNVHFLSGPVISMAATIITAFGAGFITYGALDL